MADTLVVPEYSEEPADAPPLSADAPPAKPQLLIAGQPAGRVGAGAALLAIVVLIVVLAAGGDDAAMVTSTAPEIEVVLERNRGEALGIALGQDHAGALASKAFADAAADAAPAAGDDGDFIL